MRTSKGWLRVQTNKIPYRDAQGDVVGVIGYAIDITEQTQMELQREKIFLELKKKFPSSSSLVECFPYVPPATKYAIPKVFGSIWKLLSEIARKQNSAMGFIRTVQNVCIRNFTKRNHWLENIDFLY
jgi:hypothetical protein